MLKIGDVAPAFELPNQDGNLFSFPGDSPQKSLLVFYPGDNTPVCTRQLCDYRDGIESFAGLDIRVVGISKDGALSHQEFRKKHNLPFDLLSDPNLEVAAKYDSKGMLGMKRSVFLVDESGIIRYLHVESLAVFRRTREEILEAIAKLDPG